MVSAVSGCTSCHSHQVEASNNAPSLTSTLASAPRSGPVAAQDVSAADTAATRSTASVQAALNELMAGR